MAFIRYLAAALTIGAAAAQGSGCSADSTLTVSAASAASSVASCQSFKGDIQFVKGAATGGKLDLGQLGKIDGSLTYSDDDAVETISAPGLQSVGDLNLTNLVHLSALDMSRLGTAGNMTLIGLGSLQTFDFGTPGVRKAGGITIINTQITKLDGINMATEILSLDVSDNKFLSQIGMNISKVGSISIGPNNVAQGQQAQFPRLETGTFLSFRNCTVVNVPSLTNVSTILGLYGNLFTSFSAPNLTWAGGVVVDDNSKLTNLSFPMLKSINSSNATLQIANNSQLLKVDGFPKLENVKGNVDLSGAMDEVDFNSTIKLIDGAFDLDTSSKTLKCDDTNKLGDNQVVRGKVSCQSDDANPTSANGDGGSGGSGGSSSSNVAVPVPMPAWYTGSGVLVSVLSFFFLL